MQILRLSIAILVSAPILILIVGDWGFTAALLVPFTILGFTTNVIKRHTHHED